MPTTINTNPKSSLKSMEAIFVVITIQGLLNCQNAYQKHPGTDLPSNSLETIKLFIAQGLIPTSFGKNVKMKGINPFKRKFWTKMHDT